jgi:hypothetical protein
MRGNEIVIATSDKTSNLSLPQDPKVLQDGTTHLVRPENSSGSLNGLWSVQTREAIEQNDCYLRSS